MSLRTFILSMVFIAVGCAWLIGLIGYTAEAQKLDYEGRCRKLGGVVIETAHQRNCWKGNGYVMDSGSIL